MKSALPGIHNDEWQALMSYRSSLMQHNEFDLPTNRAPGRHYSKGRKRGQEFEGTFPSSRSLSQTTNPDPLFSAFLKEEDAEQEDNESEIGSEMAEG